MARHAATVLLLVAACDSEFWGKGGDDTTPNVDGQPDADADADADSDTDADSDADTDTGTGQELDCDAVYDTPAPGTGGGTCVTEVLDCGDVIFATNEGGSTIYDYQYWLDQGEVGSLMGNTDALDGPERSYVFEGVQQGYGVRVTVESCMDSWATWIRYGDVGGSYCDLDPFNTGGIFESSSGPRLRWTERINTSSASGYDFEFQVEGLEGAVGNFKLTVECF